MPMYVRRTQSVQLSELTDRIPGKLAEHGGPADPGPLPDTIKPWDKQFAVYAVRR
jgi:hypothetical protein